MTNNISRFSTELHGGQTVCFFVNKETGLIVVDVVREDGRGGNEILRRFAKDVPMPTDKELDEVASQ